MDEASVRMILAVILFFIGIILALFGRAVWGSLMSILGSMIGWFIGFAIGVYFLKPDSTMDWVLVIIIAFIASFIMGMIFGKMVEVALALITGALVGGVFFYLSGETMIIGLIAFGVAFVLAYIFIEKIVVVVTALIGSLLAGYAIYILSRGGQDPSVNPGDANLAVLGFILIFICGMLIQTFALKDKDWT